MLNKTSGILGKVKSRFFDRRKRNDINVLDINTRYDLETIEIIKRIGVNGNGIDIGAHKGDILQHFLKYAPGGKHFAFEPLPHLYNDLKNKYGKRCTVYPYALSETNGETSFNYVISNPAYSGIKKRKYDRPHEQDTLIKVEQRRLDDIVPEDAIIQLIKIDVEGGEFDVLKGAENILSKWHPLIIYEQGLGGSDIYNTKPEVFFDFMSSFGYNISLMEYYLLNKPPFNKNDYCTQFDNAYNFYFVAYINKLK